LQLREIAVTVVVVAPIPGGFPHEFVLFALGQPGRTTKRAVVLNREPTLEGGREEEGK
jgi:hypothetical protein